MSALKNVWVVSLALLLLPAIVSSAMIRIDVTGTVSSYFSSYTAYPQAGEAMSGYCIYNSDSPDTDSSSSYGSYKLEEVFMQVGNLTFQKKSQDLAACLFVGNLSLTRTSYGALCDAATVSQNGILDGDTSFTLFNFTKSGISSPIPSTASIDWPADILSWNSYFKGLYSGGMFDGAIDSFTVIPEPASLSLLAIGAALLRKRK